MKATRANPDKKPAKGLATMIANSVGCSVTYAEAVLKGKHNERCTELVERIRRKVDEIEKVLLNKCRQ